MSQDLFEWANSEITSGPIVAPLADRMRPKALDDFYGQTHALGPGKPLRLWIETDRVPSLILWGPAGCGKTTLARIIAKNTQAIFIPLSAVQSGVRDLKESAEKAKLARQTSHRKTIIFIDEIHRFNKSQQDALLPHVEDGTLTLIGATTENPSFELNTALLSRTRVVRLERLEAPAIAKIIEHALSDPDAGLGGFLTLSSDAINWLANTSEGDARRALTSLESLALLRPAEVSGSNESAQLCIADIQAALERQPIPYDKSGEEHYNVISAFIKSLRDSDPDAALYYLARMLEAGEDPLFIARRMVILASEDIGNADPRALLIAIAVKEAVDFVGLPEARINLAQAVTYLARAPKSNASYEGINKAIAEVRESGLENGSRPRRLPQRNNIRRP